MILDCSPRPTKTDSPSSSLFKTMAKMHSYQKVDDSHNVQRMFAIVQDILDRNPEVLQRKLQAAFLRDHDDKTTMESLPMSEFKELFEYSLPIHWAACFGLTELIHMFLYDYPQSIFEPIEVLDASYFHLRKPSINLNSGIKFGRFNRNPFYLAVKCGHQDSVEELFRYYPEAIKLPDEYGNLPIHIAASNGDREIIMFLLDKHQDGSSVKNVDGLIPLHISSFHGHFEVTKLLLETDVSGSLASIVSRDNLGRTPLHLSLVGHGNNDILTTLLIDMYPNALSMYDCCHDLPLHFSVQSQRYDSVQLVFEKALEYGVFECDQFGGLFTSTCPSSAKGAAHRKSIAWNQVTEKFGLMQAMNMLRRAEGAPILHSAIGKVSLFNLRMLIGEFGIDVTSKDSKGRTPLHVFLQNAVADKENEAYIQTCRFLLGKDLKEERKTASPTTISDRSGRLPLHEAIDNKLPEAVLDEIMNANYDALGRKDPVTNLFPFMMIGQNGYPLSFIFQMLTKTPDIMALLADM